MRIRFLVGTGGELRVNGAEGAVCSIAEMSKISVPFEGAFKRAA